MQEENDAIGDGIVFAHRFKDVEFLGKLQLRFENGLGQVEVFVASSFMNYCEETVNMRSF